MRVSHSLIFSLLSGLSGVLHTNAAIGPISTSSPNVAGGRIANDAPPNSFFQGFSPPFPTTGDWWVGYAAGTGDQFAAGPFPYQTRLSNNSIFFGVSGQRNFDGTSIHQPTQVDWSVGFSEHSGNFNDHKALSWDSQSVTLQYFTGSSTLTSYMVPGSPYLTFQFATATPVITSQNGTISSFAGQSVTAGGAAVSSTGTKFKVISGAGTYIIYSLNGGITLSATSSAITASSKFNGVLRIVQLQAASHETTLDTYVANYATSVTTDYSFNGDTAQLLFTWNVTGTASQYLHLTWPHHRLALTNRNYLASTAISYLTTKGYMLGTVGNAWTMSYALPTIDWNAPRSPDSSCTASILQGLEYQVAQLVATAPTAPGDFYFWGGSTAAQARLALIADHLGRTDLRNQVVQWLEQAFAYWFDSSSPTLPAYETAWGGIINKAGYNSVWVDFGNGYYNDHHFHYGYFLSVAATIAKFDASWLSQHQDYITYFARDIANPSRSDPYFTPVRNRDWFAGHSWASGIANNAGSRDQESTGEAINGYYGVMLWAEVIGNTDLKNLARLLLANEQQAAQVYWHMDPNADSNGRDQPYPEAALRQLITIGNVEDWQSGAWLFWGAEKSEIAAIQILPVTPVNEYLYATTWVENVFSYTASEDAEDEWKCVIYLAYSQANPQAAAAYSANLTDWGSGNTYTNQLYFLSTRPNPSGQPICTASSTNPVGNFTLQAVGSNHYVTSSASQNNLYASATSAANATVYQLGFAPGGGTIQALNTDQFVTADSSGNYTISAARATAQAWEIFTIRPKVGAASGVYTIRAASNKLWVVVNPDGSLQNSATTESQATGFVLSGTSGSGSGGSGSGSSNGTVPSNAMLRHVATGQFISVSGTFGSVGTPVTNPYLHAVTNSSGTMWQFPDLTDGSGNPVKGILEQDNQLYVTSNDAGADQLQALRQVAQAWEFFLPEVSGCQVAFKMQINGLYVGLRSDGSVYADQSSKGSATMFSFVGGTSSCV